MDFYIHLSVNHLNDSAKIEVAVRILMVLSLFECVWNNYIQSALNTLYSQSLFRGSKYRQARASLCVDHLPNPFEKVITSNKIAEIGVWIQMNFKYIYISTFLQKKMNEKDYIIRKGDAFRKKSVKIKIYNLIIFYLISIIDQIECGFN